MNCYLPAFDSYFAEQNVYLGRTIFFDFRVSDIDGGTLYVGFGYCPYFATNLFELSLNTYRITISPLLTDFSLVGTIQICEVTVNDGLNTVF